MALLTPCWSLDVLLVFLSGVIVAYLHVTRNFNYWSKRGVTELRPIPFVGNFLEICLFRKTAFAYFRNIYEGSKGLPYLGFYIFDKPALLVRDPDIVNHVLIKDFNSFPDRHLCTDDSDTLGQASLFVVKCPKWKSLRSKGTPMFTPGRMKLMFQLMLDAGKEMDCYLDALKLEGEGRVVEVKELNASFMVDVFSSSAFGLQVNSMKDPNDQFRKCGLDVFGCPTITRAIEFGLLFYSPALVKLLKLQFFSTESSNFMRKAITKTITDRIENHIYRNDVIDMLIQQKKPQTANCEDSDFGVDGLIGQAASLFVAGFDPSATTLTFTLYELALHPDVQSKLREELTSALAENDGKFTYEMAMNLPYLDAVVSETLRKYPPVAALDRVAVHDYKVPGTDLVIEKGIPIYVPAVGFQYDPEYFPDPDKYDPEHFSPENKKKRRSCVYLPFGEGPHNCIASRFGLLLSKLGVLKYVLNYEVTPCAQTLIPMRFDRKSVLLKADGGVYLNLRRLPTLSAS